MTQNSQYSKIYLWMQGGPFHPNVILRVERKSSFSSTFSQESKDLVLSLVNKEKKKNFSLINQKSSEVENNINFGFFLIHLEKNEP